MVSAKLSTIERRAWNSVRDIGNARVCQVSKALDLPWNATAKILGKLELKGKLARRGTWFRVSRRSRGLKNKLVGRTFGKIRVLRRVEDRITPAGYSHHTWLCKCLLCDREFERRGIGILYRSQLGCVKCSRPKPTPKAERVCKWCGSETTRSPVHECGSCNRRRFRNGVCPCPVGRPLYQNKPAECCGATKV